MNAIYLASGSPRRREILENLGFTVRVFLRILMKPPKKAKPQ